MHVCECGHSLKRKKKLIILICLSINSSNLYLNTTVVEVYIYYGLNRLIKRTGARTASQLTIKAELSKSKLKEHITPKINKQINK